MSTSSTANAAQLSAINSNSSKILCLAGAGTGKTFTLIERIGRLVSEGHCKGDNILALTFTNAAAFEMKDRYVKKFSSSGSELPEFRTFHAFCYHLLSVDPMIRSSLGYGRSEPPQICEDYQVKEIQKRVKLQCNIKLTDSKIQNPELLSPQDKRMYDLYMKGVKRELIRLNYITFDMLCYDICQLFVQNSPLVQRYKQKYQYIFVDEFQDTDPKQWDFVKSFESSSLFIVGDALQALYGFRNADSSIIKKLSRTPEWEVIKLTTNYRSTKQICEFANNMSTYASNDYRIEIKSDKDGCPVYQDLVDDGSPFHDVSETALYHVFDDISQLSGTTAILCRTNAERNSVISFMEGMNVAVSTGKQNEEAQRVFNAARDNEYLMGWLSTYLNDSKYSEWLRVTALVDCSLDTGRYEMFKKLSEDNKVIVSHLRNIAKIRSVMHSSMSGQDKQKELFRLLKLHNATVRESANTNDEISAYMTEVLSINQTIDIYVGTIHSSKGLEYDNVILIGVDGSKFRLKGEEQYNCYYVGITRARNWLKVYWANGGAL